MKFDVAAESAALQVEPVPDHVPVTPFDTPLSYPAVLHLLLHSESESALL